LFSKIAPGAQRAYRYALSIRSRRSTSMQPSSLGQAQSARGRMCSSHCEHGVTLRWRETWLLHNRASESSGAALKLLTPLIALSRLSTTIWVSPRCTCTVCGTRRLAARRAVPTLSQFWGSQSRGQLEGGESAANSASDLVI